MACACGGGGCVACGGRLPLADRLQPRVDKLRQRFTTFGLRPYEVSLVWMKWGGDERGEGSEKLLLEVPIAPRPKVVDLTSVALNPFTAGILPVGSVALEEVTTQLTEDNLTGRVVPPRAYLDACGAPRWAGFSAPPDVLGRTAIEQVGRGAPVVRDRIEEPYDFFYELQECPAGGRAPARRRRFRIAAAPFKKPGSFGWSLLLEAQSEERDRHGHSRVGPDGD